MVEKNIGYHNPMAEAWNKYKNCCQLGHEGHDINQIYNEIKWMHLLIGMNCCYKKGQNTIHN